MHIHQEKSGKASSQVTQGHIIDWGWRYDLMLWWNNLLLRGKWRELQKKIIDLAQFQPGETVLDVGCGTGTLALEAYAYVGSSLQGGITGRICGVDPGPKQIARARSKARKAGLPIDFQVGAIEQLAFPNESFDVVLSTFMMHVLPNDLKRQGLIEIARVLKPGGRILVVDFKRPEEHASKGTHQRQPERPVHTGPWNSGIQDQPPLMEEAGFSRIVYNEIETGEIRLPEIGFVSAYKI